MQAVRIGERGDRRAAFSGRLPVALLRARTNRHWSNLPGLDPAAGPADPLRQEAVAELAQVLAAALLDEPVDDVHS